MPTKNTERQIVLKVPVGDAPEGFTTMNGMRHEFGVKQYMLEKAVKKLKASGEIGEDIFYVFENNRTLRGYSPEDQQTVHGFLTSIGAYAEVAPETYLANSELNEFFDVSPQTLGKALGALREAGIIGEEHIYKFGFRAQMGFSPEEQNAVYDWLKNNNFLAPLAPKEQLSISVFSKWLGITESPTLKAIETLQAEGVLGELPYHRFSSHRSQSLSPWDQNAVRDKLISTGKIAPLAPEGCLPLDKLAAACTVSPKTLRTVITALEQSGELQPPEYYKFSPRSALGYTVEQRAIVETYMKEQGILVEANPEGYLSLNGLSTELDISRHAIQNAVNAVSDAEFGNVERYRFDAVTTNGYSRDQQNRIIEYLEKKGLFKPAPDEYVKLSTLIKDTGRDRETVLKAITQLQEAGELGEVANYSFTGKVLRGYSPEQQVQIATTLLSYGTNPIDRAETVDMPNDYKTVAHLGELTGIAWNKITRVADAIDTEIMGKVRRYKMDDVARKAYSPEQQKLVLAELEARGILSPEAPENYLTFTDFRDIAKVSHAELRKVIDGMNEDDLGPVERYHFKDNTSLAIAYSPTQQQLILEKLADTRAKEGWPPQGFESVSTFARRLGIASTSVDKAVKTIEQEVLGPLGTYKFKTKWTIGLSPKQREVISARLIEQGVLVPTAPEDVLSRNQFAIALQLRLEKVIKLIDIMDAEGELSEPKNYRFNKAPRPFRGLTYEDQEKIKQRLKKQQNKT